MVGHNWIGLPSLWQRVGEDVRTELDNRLSNSMAWELQLEPVGNVPVWVMITVVVIGGVAYTALVVYTGGGAAPLIFVGA